MKKKKKPINFVIFLDLEKNFLFLLFVWASILMISKPSFHLRQLIILGTYQKHITMVTTHPISTRTPDRETISYACPISFLLFPLLLLFFFFLPLLCSIFIFSYSFSLSLIYFPFSSATLSFSCCFWTLISSSCLFIEMMSLPS